VHQVYGDAARQLGHITGTGGLGGGPRAASGEQDRPDASGGT
jgi:hypothetical protein